ncbi:uncharacterized protein LOC121768796 [Salvia splendens]|nr:uncharacterized protein LOC121768796 [Salvia splendens]
MATRSEEEEKEKEVRSTSEFKCMHPLYYVLDSQNGCFSSEMMAPRTSFDEECRKIQYEAEFATSSRANASGRSLRGLTQEEDAHILQQRNKDRTDSHLIDHLMESGHKSATKVHPRAYESCLCHSDDSTNSIHKRPAAQVGARFEPKPFSNALAVLSSDKDLLVVEFFPETYCLPKNCIKDLQTEKQTVTFKAEIQKTQHSGRFACHCSSREVGDRSRLNRSLVSLSVGEIKRKLKLTFGSRRRKGSEHWPRFRLLHNRSIFGYDCFYSGVETRNRLSSNTNAKAKKNVVKKEGLLKGERKFLAAGEAETARTKIDVSRDVLSEKHGVDASATTRLQNPWRVMSSLDMESCFSPRRESQYIPGSAQASLISPSRQSIYMSPMRTCKDIAPCDGTAGSVRAEANSSLVDEEARITPSPNIKFIDTPNTVGSGNVHHSEAQHDAMINNAKRAEKLKLMHSIMDSISENKTFSNAADDFPSSPTCDIRDNNKYQEEYESPVSVLGHFFAEDSSSPWNVTFQSARGALKPRRLHFEGHKSASPSQATATGSGPCMHDQDYTITNYVLMILKASGLNWDQLSAMRLQSEHLLHPSLFGQAQYLGFAPHFDTRLLFDHINEVLLETQRSHLLSPYWPAFAKPRICCFPLEEAVVDEIMRDAEFYLLPWTQRRTLEQLIAKDLSGARSWPDVRPETEQIIHHISDYILVESIIDVIFELHS